jgi:STE24 endopeptidase
MDADWMYSAYHFSHPILTERLKALGWESTEKVGKRDEDAGDGAVDDARNGAIKASGRDEL